MNRRVKMKKFNLPPLYVAIKYALDSGAYFKSEE